MYPSQVELEESVEQIFWRTWINWFKGYQMVKFFFIKGNLNVMLEKVLVVWKSSWRLEVLRNDLGDVIIDFGIWSDIDEYLLQERDTHLITFNSWIFKIYIYIFLSGTNVNRIDVIFTQKFNGKCCKDCKVILRENVATQYRLVVLDIFVIIIIIIIGWSGNC